jgi:integrase
MDVFTQEARQKAKDFLPPRDALDALAKLRNPIENAVRAGSERGRLDLILYWIVVILFATGLRANELLTLPIDFLISKQEADPQGNVRKVTYLIRRTSKNGPPDMKMLSPLAKALCRKAQRYLRILTRPAREMSEWLEANPGDVQIVGPSDRIVTIHDIESIFGLSSGYKRFGEIQSYCAKDVGDVTFDDMRKWVTRFRFDAPVDRKSGQKLSQSLAIRFFEWGGPTAMRLGKLVVSPIAYHSLRSFLAGSKPSMDSAFQRYGDHAFTLSSHQFRRLLDTVAREGGVSENELALLQGRARPAANRAYDFRSPDERAAQVRMAIRNGEAFGWIADFYWNLPETDREEFLSAATPFAYETPMGNCLGNIVEDACPHHLSCLSGCGDFIHVKGDEREIAGLRRVVSGATRALAKLATLPSCGEVDNHKDHLNRQLRGANAALAIDQDPAVPIGTPQRVFPKNVTYSDREEGK